MWLSSLSLVENQARKRAQRLTFWVRRPPGGVGVFHAKGWWPKKFVPSLESLCSLGFEERNLGCRGNFAGMSRTPGDVQKVCAKKVRAHFSFPRQVRFRCVECDCLNIFSAQCCKRTHQGIQTTKNKEKEEIRTHVINLWARNPSICDCDGLVLKVGYVDEPFWWICCGQIVEILGPLGRTDSSRILLLSCQIVSLLLLPDLFS